jgi:amino acid transporter
VTQKNNRDFNRVLTRIDVLVLAFGAMIGWGWVVLSNEWILSAGSLGAMIAFLLGGILVIFVGLTYAELTTVFPKTGGAYFFVKETLGKRFAFIVSWALFIGFIVLYMPGMPSALVWPYEWTITLIWWIIGFYFLLKIPNNIETGFKGEIRDEQPTNFNQ